MSEYESRQFSSFVKGVNASASKTNQPQGSIPRSSNQVLTRRGSLVTCDGSKILHSFNGTPVAGRGKVMASKLFSPTGVSRYYLSLMKALDIPLGAPQNLTVATAAGGSLAAATYYYKVTAIDGSGGETIASNEVNIVTPLNNKNTLTWNIVPNVTGYNIYRSTSSGTEVRLTGSPTATIPVVQVAYGTLIVTFVDDGTTSIPTYTVVSASCYQASGGAGLATFTILSTSGLSVGSPFTLVGSSNIHFNRVWTVFGINNATQFTGRFTGFGLGSLETTTGGTFNTASPTPIADTTQQTALYKMPVIPGSPAILPTPYNNSNIAALFPADPNTPNIDGGGGGGSGGGGGTGGGGSGGGTGTGTSTASGGIPGNVSLIPEMVQFSNRMVLALGNGFPGQLFADPTTLTNPALSAVISAISVDAFGVVTITTATAHGILPAQVGANILISGVANATYNTNSSGCSAFVVISIPDATHLKVVNLSAIGQAASAGGTITS